MIALAASVLAAALWTGTAKVDVRDLRRLPADSYLGGEACATNSSVTP
jgi:hypothetical protein